MKKKTKRNILILCGIILAIIIAFILRYFLYIRPLENKLIDNSLKYAELENNIYNLPEKYKGKTSLTNDEESQIENEMKAKLIIFLKPDTVYFEKKLRINMSILKDQVVGKLEIKAPTKIASHKVLETKIKSDTAIVRIEVTVSVSEIRDNEPCYNNITTQYGFEYKKIQGKWLINNVSSRPMV